MDTATIQTALATVGIRVTEETLRSQAQSESEMKPKPQPQLPTLARGWPAQSQKFRDDLFRLDEEHHAQVRALAMCGEWYVRRLANNQTEGGRCLALCGPPGTGKTHVAKSIYSYVQSWGVDICFKHDMKHPLPTWIDWPDIAEKDSQEDFEDTCHELDRSRFFVLDDIGSESDRFKNSAPASRLRRILSRTEGKWIVLTTNLTQSECFDFYDARIVDRLKTFHWFQLLEVPSYRGKR